MSASDPPAYTQTTVDHFRQPHNVGQLDGANAVGTVDDRETENLITLYLRIVDGRVVEASFRAFACSACIAASSIVTDLVLAKTPAECHALDGAAVDGALGGLPASKRHCADLAAQALAEALRAFATPSPANGRGSG